MPRSEQTVLTDWNSARKNCNATLGSPERPPGMEQPTYDRN
jgi:hypothetical protein